MSKYLPIVLDVAGFAALVVGSWLLFGAWAWITAGALLILAGGLVSSDSEIWKV